MIRDKIAIHRLSSSKEISAIFSENCRVSSDLGLILWKTKESDNIRAAYCVSKKHGNAVKRNRIKRVLRQLVQNNKEIFPENTDFVIIPSQRQKQWSTKICDVAFIKLVKKFANQRQHQRTNQS